MTHPLLLGASIAIAFRVVLFVFRRTAPAHAVAALDRAGPGDWGACGLFALFFVFCLAI